MVYYFTSSVVSPSAFLYVGKDKFESKVFKAYLQEARVKSIRQTRSSLSTDGRTTCGMCCFVTDHSEVCTFLTLEG